MEINRSMLLQSFREETEECLAQMEQSLLALETHPEDRELVSSLFRAAHTIKNNSSLLEFNALAHFLHAGIVGARSGAQPQIGQRPCV